MEGNISYESNVNESQEWKKGAHTHEVGVNDEPKKNRIKKQSKQDPISQTHSEVSVKQTF